MRGLHRAAELEVYSVDRDLLAALASRLDRRTKFTLSVTERHLYITMGTDTLTGLGGNDVITAITITRERADTMRFF